MPEDNRLRTLYDYTVFHIGMYATLISALFGLIALADKLHSVLPILPYIKFTVCCFLVAGAAGGAIASNIPENQNFNLFKSRPLHVFGLENLLNGMLGPAFHYSIVSRVEHLAFWLGIAVSAWGFVHLSVS